MILFLMVTVRQGLMFIGGCAPANMAAFFVLHTYIILVLIFLYRDLWYYKLIIYGIFNIFEVLAEAIVFVIAKQIYPELPSLVTVLCYQTAIYTIIVRALIVLIVYIFFFKNQSAFKKVAKNKELFPIIVLVLLLYIPILVLIENEEMVSKGKVFDFYMLCVLLVLLILSIYIIYLVCQNERKVGIVEEKLQSAEKIIQMTTSVHELRHDMMFHVNVLLDLLYKEKQEEAIEYIENSFACVRVLESTFNLEDPAITSSLNLIAKKAKDKQIKFNHIITVGDFGLPSHEMCSLLLNILSNAIEAAEKTSRKRRIICLEISPAEGGYHINCINTYKEKPVFTKGKMVSSKVEKGHGKGIGIIKNVVEKYGGAMDIAIHEEQKLFEINCFIPNRVGEN